MPVVGKFELLFQIALIVLLLCGVLGSLFDVKPRKPKPADQQRFHRDPTRPRPRRTDMSEEVAGQIEARIHRLTNRPKV